MKINQIKNELKALDIDELKGRLEQTRQMFLQFRLNFITQREVQDYSQFKKLRRLIACMETYLIEKQRVI
ncbi:MAG: 50S ribosomal protein L29 [Candidatus Babeliales bacterium]